MRIMIRFWMLLPSSVNGETHKGGAKAQNSETNIKMTGLKENIKMIYRSGKRNSF
jgi:hypothetical protein